MIADSGRSRFLYFTLFFAFVTAAFICQSQTRPKPGSPINYFIVAADFFICLIILCVQYANLRANQSNFEKAIVTQLYEQSVRQYKAFQKSVDYVNIKIHDFKHQIIEYERNGKLDSHSVKKALEEVEIYETFAKTGNETLDIILTDYFLYCRSKKIEFSYMAEASGFEKIERSDIYSLFSNILNNAVEHTDKYEDEQKRFIRLIVKQAGKILIIHTENYFEGELRFVNDLPATTKTRKLDHGFGLLSVKNIAHKYDGSLKIKIKDNLFQIDILLQV